MKGDEINYCSNRGSYLTNPYNENDILYFGMGGPERSVREDETKPWKRIRLVDSTEGMLNRQTLIPLLIVIFLLGMLAGIAVMGTIVTSN